MLYGQAKAGTKRAQMAGVACLAAAVGVLVLPSDWTGLGVPASVNAAIEQGGSPPSRSGNGDRLGASTKELALALDGVVSMTVAKEQPPAPPPPVDTATGEVPPAPPPPPKIVWKYLGAMLAPGFKRAIVREDQKQRMLSVGDAYDKARVIDIFADRLRVRDDNGNEYDVPIADRMGRPAVTVAAPVATPQAPEAKLGDLNDPFWSRVAFPEGAGLEVITKMAAVGNPVAVEIMDLRRQWDEEQALLARRMQEQGMPLEHIEGMDAPTRAKLLGVSEADLVDSRIRAATEDLMERLQKGMSGIKPR